jgi:hypothetical protein
LQNTIAEDNEFAAVLQALMKSAVLLICSDSSAPLATQFSIVDAPS